MPFDFLEQIETDLLAAGSGDVIALPAALEAPPGGADAAQEDAPAISVDLMDAATFHGQFALIHDVMGGMVQMRTGAPCPLGEAARAEGGQAAANAIYELASNNPTLAKLILSTESTYLGQVMAIGMHGFSCIQIVKASGRGDTIEHEATE